METSVKRRKLSLKEKRLTILSDQKEYGIKCDGNDREIDIDTAKDEEEIHSDANHGAIEKITPELRDLRNKLLALRHNKKSDDCNKGLLQWPWPKKMIARDDENPSEDTTDRDGTKNTKDSTNKNSCNDKIVWPKPCFKCLMMKAYPKINILEEALKNCDQKDYNLRLQKNEPVLHDPSDAANFELMDLPMSEDDICEESSPMLEKCTNILNNSERMKDTDPLISDRNTSNIEVMCESECQQERLNVCPMCQLVFDESYGTMEIDGHLAQCLAAAGDDDIAW